MEGLFCKFLGAVLYNLWKIVIFLNSFDRFKEPIAWDINQERDFIRGKEEIDVLEKERLVL
jgi:hypothetical protein